MLLRKKYRFKKWLIWCDSTSLFFFFFLVCSPRFFRLCRKDKTGAVHYWNAKDASSCVLFHLTETKRETHVDCAWVFLHTSGTSSENISSSGHSVSSSIQTDAWEYKLISQGWNGDNTSHECTLHLSVRCGNVSLWSSNYSMSLSTMYSFTLYLWLYPFLSLSLNVAFPF